MDFPGTGFVSLFLGCDSSQGYSIHSPGCTTLVTIFENGNQEESSLNTSISFQLIFQHFECHSVQIVGKIKEEGRERKRSFNYSTCRHLRRNAISRGRNERSCHV